MGNNESLLKGKPRILGALEEARLKLDPREGFLLSRIDGQLTVEQILPLTGMDRTEALDIIVRLWAKGLIALDSADDALRVAALQKEKSSPGSEPSGVTWDERQRILSFYDRLEKDTYYELLGIPRDAPQKEIKAAYFTLSREYHPDRFFRRDIGDFRWRLESIFKKLTEAYQVLYNPQTREDYNKTIPAEQKHFEQVRQEQGPAPPTPKEAEVPQEIQEKVEKAREFFDAGLKDSLEKKYASAAANFKLAMVYDPFNDKYKKHYEEAHGIVVRTEIERFLHAASSAESILHHDESKRFLLKALELSPDHAQAHHKLARMMLMTGEGLKEARDHCLKALAKEPDNVEYRLTLAQIFMDGKLFKNAFREYDTILKKDPKNEEALAQIKELKGLI